MSRTLPTRIQYDRAADLAVETMRDRCVLCVRSITQDAATGMPIEAWADGAETVCGVAVKTTHEVEGSTQVPIAIITLRLPLTLPAVDMLARVRVTHVRGQPLAVPETYAITGAVRGTIQWRCDLVRVAHTLEGA